MPRALNPSATFRVVLKSDEEQGDRAPAFVFKYLTANEYNEVNRLLQGREATEENAPAIKQDVFGAIRMGLRGWENMAGHDYDPAKLEDVLDFGEAYELAFGMITGGRLSVDDRKNSQSPSPTSEDNSASAAAVPESA